MAFTHQISRRRTDNHLYFEIMNSATSGASQDQAKGWRSGWMRTAASLLAVVNIAAMAAQSAGAPTPPPKQDAPAKAASAPLSHAGQRLPKVIEAMIRNGRDVKVLERFDAGSGLTGYVLSSAGAERRIFYVTADHKKAILGLVFNDQLENLTADHQRQHIDVSDVLKAKTARLKFPQHPLEVASALPSQAGWTQGSGLEVFVYVDVDSEASREMVRQLQRHMEMLKIRWLPVHGAAHAKGNVIDSLLSMPEKDRVRIWKSWAVGQQKQLNPGVSPSADGSVGQAAKAAQAAFDQLSAAGLNPPVLLFEDRRGNSRIVAGLPSSAEWGDLLGAAREWRHARDRSSAARSN